jgi:hypothetical protein
VTDDLSSLRDGRTKQSILDFVAHTAGEHGSTPVPPEERIAVFDNDGTLWCEKPMPIQLDFILRRLGELVAAEPALATQQPWKAVSERDHGWFSALMEEHYAGDDTKGRLLARESSPPTRGLASKTSRNPPTASCAQLSIPRSAAATRRPLLAVGTPTGTRRCWNLSTAPTTRRSGSLSHTMTPSASSTTPVVLSERCDKRRRTGGPS